MQQRLDGDMRPGRPLAVARARLADPRDQALVQIGVRPQRAVQPPPVGEQAGHQRIQVVDGMGGVGAVVRLRGVLADGAPLPGLAQRIAFAREKDERAFGPPRRDHRDGIGLDKTGQIAKVAVLTKRIIDIAVARTLAGPGNDRNGVIAHAGHQGVAATGVFTGIHGVGVSAQCSTSGSARSPGSTGWAEEGSAVCSRTSRVAARRYSTSSV